MTDIKYDGVSFNLSVIISCTMEEFVTMKGFQQMWPGVTDEKRRMKLVEVYTLGKLMIDANS
jgi:hypothetical protein